MKIQLGFSPCPNDTFIFDALVHKKIETEGLDFEIHLEDVQQLNQWAIEGRLDITKISYGVLPLLHEKYVVFNSGSALGKGVGPLLISKKNNYAPQETFENKTIAIPGENTTAHLLFSWAFPKATLKKFMIFSSIEDAVASGDVDLGVIIHENRFTYEAKGLSKILDLGTFWEEKTKQQIPLGGIVGKRTLPKEILQKIDSLIATSVQYAFENSLLKLPEFIQCHAQEMDEQVMRQHINLYVNRYSIHLGIDGRGAIKQLMDIYLKLHPEHQMETPLFID